MECEIVADVDHQRVRPGDRVNTKVLLTLDRGIRLRRITATFAGSERVQFEVSGGNSDDDRTVRRTRHLAEDAFLLAGSDPAGWLADAIDSVYTLFGKGGVNFLQPGSHEYDVSWNIPLDAPPSYDGRHATIAYRLTIRADRPLRRNDVFDLEFNVMPSTTLQAQPVTVHYPDDDSGILDKAFARKLRARASLEKDVFQTGDTVRGSFLLEVDEPVEIKTIHAGLLSEEHAKIRRDSKKTHKRYDRFELAPSMHCEDSWTGDFSFEIDDVPFPTVQGEHFQCRWFVEIHIDVAWAKDSKVLIPIKLFPN